MRTQRYRVLWLRQHHHDSYAGGRLAISFPPPQSRPLLLAARSHHSSSSSALPLCHTSSSTPFRQAFFRSRLSPSTWVAYCSPPSTRNGVAGQFRRAATLAEENQPTQAALQQELSKLSELRDQRQIYATVDRFLSLPSSSPILQNIDTFTTLMRVCSNANHTEQATSTFLKLQECGHAPTLPLFNFYLRNLSRNKDLNGALRLLDMMQHEYKMLPNSVSLNYILSCLYFCLRTHEVQAPSVYDHFNINGGVNKKLLLAFELFNDMVTDKYGEAGKPNAYTYYLMQKISQEVGSEGALLFFWRERAKLFPINAKDFAKLLMDIMDCSGGLSVNAVMELVELLSQMTPKGGYDEKGKAEEKDEKLTKYEKLLELNRYDMELMLHDVNEPAIAELWRRLILKCAALADFEKALHLFRTARAKDLLTPASNLYIDLLSVYSYCTEVLSLKYQTLDNMHQRALIMENALSIPLSELQSLKDEQETSDLFLEEHEDITALDLLNDLEVLRRRELSRSTAMDDNHAQHGRETVREDMDSLLVTAQRSQAWADKLADELLRNFHQVVEGEGNGVEAIKRLFHLAVSTHQPSSSPEQEELWKNRLFGSLLHSLVHNKMTSKAVQVLNWMEEANFAPTANMYSAVMKGFARIGDWDNIVTLYNRMVERGCQLNHTVYGQLYDALGVHCDLKRQQAEFKVRQQPTVLEQLTSHIANNPNMTPVSVKHKYKELEANRAEAYTKTVDDILAEQKPKFLFIGEEMNKHGVKHSLYSLHKLIQALGKTHQARQAISLIEMMLVGNVKGIPTWSDEYGLHPILPFRDIRKESNAEQVTVDHLLKISTKLPRDLLARRFKENTEQALPLYPNTLTFNILLNALNTHPTLDTLNEVDKVTKLMRNAGKTMELPFDNFTFNEILVAHADRYSFTRQEDQRAAILDSALATYMKMKKKKLKPDGVTIGILFRFVGSRSRGMYRRYSPLAIAAYMGRKKALHEARSKQSDLSLPVEEEEEELLQQNGMLMKEDTGSDVAQLLDDQLTLESEMDFAELDTLLDINEAGPSATLLPTSKEAEHDPNEYERLEKFIWEEVTNYGLAGKPEFETVWYNTLVRQLSHVNLDRALRYYQEARSKGYLLNINYISFWNLGLGLLNEDDLPRFLRLFQDFATVYPHSLSLFEHLATRWYYFMGGHTKQHLVVQASHMTAIQSSQACQGLVSFILHLYQEPLSPPISLANKQRTTTTSSDDNHHQEEGRRRREDMRRGSRRRDQFNF